MNLSFQDEVKWRVTIDANADRVAEASKDNFDNILFRRILSHSKSTEVERAKLQAAKGEYASLVQKSSYVNAEFADAVRFDDLGPWVIDPFSGEVWMTRLSDGAEVSVARVTPFADQALSLGHSLLEFTEQLGKRIGNIAEPGGTINSLEVQNLVERMIAELQEGN